MFDPIDDDVFVGRESSRGIAVAGTCIAAPSNDGVAALGGRQLGV
jgi:hypothetical protein